MSVDSALAAVKRMVIIETITGTVMTVILDCLVACPIEEVKNLINLLCMNVLISGIPFIRALLSISRKTFNTVIYI